MKRITTQDVLRNINKAPSRPISSHLETPPASKKTSNHDLLETLLQPTEQPTNIVLKRPKKQVYTQSGKGSKLSLLMEPKPNIIDRRADKPIPNYEINETIKTTLKPEQRPSLSLEDRDPTNQQPKLSMHIQYEPTLPTSIMKGLTQKALSHSNMIAKRPQNNRHCSQEQQLKSYLANIRKGTDTRKKLLVESSSSNSTLLFQGSLPSSTKHIRHFEFHPDKMLTQQNILSPHQKPSKEDELQLVLARSQKVLSDYQQRLLEFRSVISSKDRQIAHLQSVVQTYANRYGPLEQ